MNPIFPGWYADPEVRRFGDTCWCYPTRSQDFGDQLAFDAFSSRDLVHWTRHEAVFSAESCSWLRKCLWAPVVFAHRGRYWMIFSANDIQVPESPWWQPHMADVPQHGGLGLAVADEPAGPFVDALGHPLLGEVIHGAQPIDACVFADDTGGIWMAYGGWGHCNLARLRDDLQGLEPFADGTLVTPITPSPSYVEGPFIFRRGHWWYFLWSEGDWANDSYRVVHARADDFRGPWQHGGVVLRSQPPIATGAGHCSVLQLPGDRNFIFYHRRPDIIERIRLWIQPLYDKIDQQLKRCNYLQLDDEARQRVDGFSPAGVRNAGALRAA